MIVLIKASGLIACEIGAIRAIIRRIEINEISFFCRTHSKFKVFVLYRYVIFIEVLANRNEGFSFTDSWIFVIAIWSIKKSSRIYPVETVVACFIKIDQAGSFFNV